MKKMFKKMIGVMLSTILGIGLLTGCSAGNSSADSNDANTTESSDGDTETKSINMVYVNWSDSIALTSLAKVILENELGYEVNLTMADIAPIFTAIANGDQDVYMDAWLPITHGNYMKEYGDDIEDISVCFTEALSGLVVPSYMDIDSIDQLNDIADELDSEIIGIDPGAGLMQSTETVIEKYGLNLDLISGSEAAMTAMLSDAIDNKEPIVVTGWAPHWMFAKWDLKFLKDPDMVYGEAEKIHVLGRTGFSSEYPEATKFFQNFSIDNTQMAELMDAISNSEEEPETVAAEWLSKHEDLKNAWLSDSKE